MLRQLVTTAILVLSATAILADEMSSSAALSDIALARETLETIHPGYDRYTDKAVLDATWAALEQFARGGIERAELYVQLSILLGLIRCDHTLAELPADMAKARDTERVYLPFRFKLFDGRMYVDTSGDAALVRGEEILSIDGPPVSRWLFLLEPLIPVDGDTNHAKAGVIEYSTEFMGGALDHFGPMLTPLVSRNRARLEVRGLDGELRTIVVDRIDYVAYQALTGEKRYSRNFRDAIRFETLGDDAAYLAVDTFVNYRMPVDPVVHLEPYFKAMREEGRTKLIVDVRKNGGGSNDAQTALLRYLINKPVLQTDGLLTRFTSIPESIRPHLGTWDEAALNPKPDWFEPADDGFYRFVAGPAPVPVDPLPYAFDGDIVVLIGSGNASGVTHMLANLATHGGIRFVGEKTGGAPTGATANVIYFLTLPESGIVIRVPAQRTLIAGRDALPERDGLPPDVAVEQTAEHWFAGRDRTLEVAKQALGLQPGPASVGEPRSDLDLAVQRSMYRALVRDLDEPQPLGFR